MRGLERGQLIIWFMALLLGLNVLAVMGTFAFVALFSGVPEEVVLVVSVSACLVALFATSMWRRH